jgi:hypothetical protein
MTTILTRSIFERYELKTISELATFVSMPEIQRVVDSDRVEAIYQEILESYKKKIEPFFPGVLTIAEVGDKSYLLDGQHRFLAFVKLREHNYDIRVVVNTIKVKNEDEMRMLFNLVNKSCPANEIPPSKTNYTDAQKILKHFTDHYKNNFSSNTRSNRPKINRNSFEMHIRELLAVYPNSDELIRVLLAHNETLRHRADNTFPQTSGSRKSIAEYKTLADEQGGLMFGLFPDGSCFDELKLTPNFKREKVSSALREATWQRYYGKKNSGKCLFCDTEVSRKTCHIAHDVAHKNGGGLTIENLYIACAKCNLSMGDKTFEQWHSQVLLLDYPEPDLPEIVE